MTDTPSRRIELETRIAASLDAVWRALSDAEELKRWFPLDARVRPGPGGEMMLSWGDGEWTVPIVEWNPPHRLRTAYTMPDRDGTPREIVVDWQVSGVDGAAIVRLVQSGFGDGADWDDQYDGTSAGWRYFLYNLKHYLERHAGKPRALLHARGALASDGEGALAHVFGPAGLRSRPGLDALAPGARCEIVLGEQRLEGTVAVRGGDRTVALLIPELDDALLFVEREGPARTGVWLSLYGLPEARTREMERSMEAFRRQVMT